MHLSVVQAHASVTKHMIHGPCGPANTSCPCMSAPAGEPDAPRSRYVCSKRYPKRFKAATSDGNDSYPEYRRRDDGRRFTR